MEKQTEKRSIKINNPTNHKIEVVSTGVFSEIHVDGKPVKEAIKGINAFSIKSLKSMQVTFSNGELHLEVLTKKASQPLTFHLVPHEKVFYAYNVKGGNREISRTVKNWFTQNSSDEQPIHVGYSKHKVVVLTERENLYVFSKKEFAKLHSQPISGFKEKQSGVKILGNLYTNIELSSIPNGGVIGKEPARFFKIGSGHRPNTKNSD